MTGAYKNSPKVLSQSPKNPISDTHKEFRRTKKNLGHFLAMKHKSSKHGGEEFLIPGAEGRGASPPRSLPWALPKDVGSG